MRSPAAVTRELVEPLGEVFVAASNGEYLDAAAHLERAATVLREAEEEREHDALPHPT